MSDLIIATIIGGLITAILGPIIVERYRNTQNTRKSIQAKEFTVKKRDNPPKGSVESLSVEHGVRIIDRKGIRIHVGLMTGYARDIRCMVAAYFSYSNDKPLKDTNLEYRSLEGQVSTGATLTPNLEFQTFKDILLSIPYEEFHILEGTHELKFFVLLYDLEADQNIAKSKDYKFVFNATNLNSIPKPSGNVDKAWLEHNVTDNGRLGIRVHVACGINNLRNIKCSADVYFRHDTGEPLRDTNKKYMSSDGQVAATANFIPPYEATTYSDLVIFIPVKEFHLSAGSYKLKCHVELHATPTNSLIAKSSDMNFTATI